MQDTARHANQAVVSAAKAERLAAIAEAIRSLEISPLYEFRKQHGYHPVIGEGEPDARMMFVGEAPGEQEAKSGRPFVGNAGRVLDRLLSSIGMNRKDIYITSVVKDRPPANRDPRAEEIQLYAPFLMQQIATIQPTVIVTLGRIAKDLVMEQFGLPEHVQKIGELHGKALRANASFGAVTIVPMYHPAAAFYNQELQEVMATDFQVLRQFV